jgi:hypothetical protein
MDAKRILKRRAGIETAIAGLTGFLFLLSFVTREWIEALTGWDPDHGNGSVELLIVAVLAVATIAIGMRARTDWHKVQTLPA